MGVEVFYPILMSDYLDSCIHKFNNMYNPVCGTGIQQIRIIVI